MNVEMVLVVWIFLWRQMKTVSALFRKYKTYLSLYVTAQIILALWLVLAHDLFQERRTIDVIITKLFPLASVCQNDGQFWEFLHDWAG